MERPLWRPETGLGDGAGSTAKAGGFRDGPRCPALLAQTCALLALTGSVVLPRVLLMGTWTLWWAACHRALEHDLGREPCV